MSWQGHETCDGRAGWGRGVVVWKRYRTGWLAERREQRWEGSRGEVTGGMAEGGDMQAGRTNGMAGCQGFGMSGLAE